MDKGRSGPAATALRRLGRAEVRKAPGAAGRRRGPNARRATGKREPPSLSFEVVAFGGRPVQRGPNRSATAMPDDQISLTEAARIAGVSASTLQRWTRAGVIPVRGGRWTTAAAAQARVVARMRERGHSLDELRRAVREGRLAFGYVEDLLPGRERHLTWREAAERTGLEEALIERMMALLGTPTAIEGTLSEQDVRAMEQIRDVLRAGF